MPPKKIAAATGNANDYQLLDAKTHVLLRPDSYIGSIAAERQLLWTWTAGNMIKAEVDYNPGLLKIVDEMFTNASDHVLRQKELAVTAANTDRKINVVKTIKITIDRATGEFTVFNDGDGIPADIHPEHNVYMAELIFGNVFAGSNFDDNQQRKWGGKNGIGAKACNIFSKSFTVRTVDATKKVLYEQTFRDNMTIKDAPAVTKYTKVPFTEFMFTPDYARFGTRGLTDDMYAVVSRRVYDLCAITGDEVKVYFNGEKLECKNFERYIDYYIGKKTECPRVYKAFNADWEVGVACSNGGFEHITLVNGLHTVKGGRHLDYVVKQIVDAITELVKKKKKITVKAQDVKNNLFVFIKCTIANPSFDSQTKETLTTPVAKFGSKCEIGEDFVAKLLTPDFLERLADANAVENAKALKKIDGKKSAKVYGIEKLDDANMAGTANSSECTLILTEGDSAATTAVSGLAVVGRDKYGVFPLKGKILNVQDVTPDKITGNKEIENLVKIMGLKFGKTYNATSIKELRYGRVLMMTDSDVDGSHIKGLFFNLINTLWPSLIKIDGFISSMLTPIVKARRGTEVVSFYNLTDYKAWTVQMQAQRGGGGGGGGAWNIKYYKGLGTSDSKEAREYFRDLNTVNYAWSGEASREKLDLAFNKKRPDDRKRWLDTFDREKTLDYKQKHVAFDEFIDYDMSFFSHADNERSIPRLLDGLKPGQRKILYCSRKRNLKSEVKVAQLSGYVAEHGAYHHGEVSLQQTIVKMAQDFVGAANIQLLLPCGQFGTRLQGGEDSASARYIFTRLNPLTSAVFPDADDAVLTFMEDDGQLIEPEYYVPVLPMILVNGTSGIGTGYSTNVPCFNPLDIVARLRSMVNARENGTDVADAVGNFEEMVPWYNGFTGAIVKDEKGHYCSRGKWTVTSANVVEITELPIGTWTQDYKVSLEKMVAEEGPLKDYENQSTEKDVRFVLHFHPGKLDAMLHVSATSKTCFDAVFKLQTTKGLSLSNMHLYDEHGAIRLYDSVQAIIDAFFKVRWELYGKRKDHMLAALRRAVVICDAKVRFITEIIAEEFTVFNVKRADLENTLGELEYPEDCEGDGGYDYLIKMPIYNLTQEKKNALMKDAEAKRATLAQLEAKTIGALWNDDLVNFETAHTEFLAYRASADDGADAGPVEKKKRVIKSKAAK